MRSSCPCSLDISVFSSKIHKQFTVKFDLSLMSAVTELEKVLWSSDVTKTVSDTQPLVSRLRENEEALLSE